MSSVNATLAIDVGASKIAGALIDSGYQILHELVKPARQSLYGHADPDLTITKEIITELIELAKDNGIQVKNGGACFAEYVKPDQLLNSRDQIAWSAQPKDDFADDICVLLDISQSSILLIIVSILIRTNSSNWMREELAHAGKPKVGSNLYLNIVSKHRNKMADEWH